MKRILLLFIFVLTLTFQISDVKALELPSKKIDNNQEIKTNLDGSFAVYVDGEKDQLIGPEQRDYRLDSDYYSISQTIVDGALSFETQIDLTSYNLEYNDDNVQKIANIISYEVFRDVTYIDISFTYWYDTETDKIVAVGPNYAYELDNGDPDVDKCTEMQDKSIATIQDALLLITDDMTEVDKALAMHDYLVEKLQYIPSDVDQTAGSALANYETVCAGYARAYSILMDQVGIENIFVTGIAGENHAWNVIKMGKSWYHVDTTWDDIYGPTTGNISREYFLITDSQISNKFHTSWDYYTPSCGSGTYSDIVYNIFKNDKDISFYQENYYFLDRNNNLRYAPLRTYYNNSAYVDVDLSQYDGGDLYQGYLYVYSNTTHNIDEYCIETGEFTTVYNLKDYTYNGIEVNGQEVLINTVENGYILDYFDTAYFGDINVQVNSFDITGNNDNYTISVNAEISSLYDNANHKIETMPLIYMYNPTTDEYSDFEVTNIDNMNYSLSLTIPIDSTLIGSDNCYMIFEDISHNNINNFDYEFLNKDNNGFGESNSWEITYYQINAGINPNNYTILTFVDNRALEEEFLRNFYDYTVDPYSGLYSVIITDDFREKLNTSTYQEYLVGDYLWKTGDPLPNPIPSSGLYNNKKINSFEEMFRYCSNVETLDLSDFDTTGILYMDLMFADCNNLINLNISGFDTGLVRSMNHMFLNCESITTLDLSHFNTSNVFDMSGMFKNMKLLNRVDTSSFDTSNVTYMNSMFYECDSLTEIDLKNFDTLKVEDLSFMFRGCGALTSVDISGFDTLNVKKMGSMFNSCDNLKSLDLSHFNTTNVTDMSYLFYNCKELTDIDISSFDTSKVIVFDSMFRDCNNLAELDLSNFRTNNATGMKYMFSNCNKLPMLDVSGFITNNVTDMSYMFSNCNTLTSIDISSFNTSKVNKFDGMFTGCTNVESINLTGLNASSAVSMKYMFNWCSELTDLKLINTNSTKVKDFSWMFANCEKLTNLDISGLNTTSAENVKYMFSNCKSLVNLDLLNFNTFYVETFERIFYNCYNLKTLDVSSFDTRRATTMASMFGNCNSLESLDVSGFQTSRVRSFSEMFLNCKNLKTLDITNFNTSKAFSLSYMFSGCENLSEIDLSNMITSYANNMANMFKDCKSIETLDLSRFNTDNVRKMEQMFSGCQNLRTVDLSSFDTSNVTNMTDMFRSTVGLEELDLKNFTLHKDVNLNNMFFVDDNLSYLDNNLIYAIAKDMETADKYNNSSVTGIDNTHLKFVTEDNIPQPYVGNINSELIDLQIFPINDGTGDYAISGKVVVVEWVNGESTVPNVAPVMAFKGDYGDKLDVFVTAEGTNTYYFDRRISSSGLVDGQDFRFEITSGDPNNIGENKSMYLYLSTSPNVEHEKSFRISDSKSISYEMDNSGQLVIFNEDDPYDYIGNINSQLINLDVIETTDGTGDVIITGEVVVVEWVNASDPMGDPNDDPLSTVPRETPIMNFVAADGSESISVFVTPMGTNTFYFDRRISGEGLTEGKVFNFNIKSGNERNLSEYNNVNLYLSTSVGIEKSKEFTLPSGKILQYYENGIGELELSNKIS